MVSSYELCNFVLAHSLFIQLVRSAWLSLRSDWRTSCRSEVGGSAPCMRKAFIWLHLQITLI